MRYTLPGMFLLVTLWAVDAALFAAVPARPVLVFPAGALAYYLLATPAVAWVSWRRNKVAMRWGEALSLTTALMVPIVLGSVSIVMLLTIVIVLLIQIFG